MELNTCTFDAGAVILNYVEAPAPGPPLVLLHGGNARWQSFESILPDLAAEWHVYAPEFRGHGRSGWVTGSYRLQDYTDDTIAFLRGRVGEPAYLLGHSLGGIVALMVAAQYPEGIRAVVVGDSPLSSRTWHSVLLQQEDRLRAWRELAGGQVSFDQLVEAVKAAPIEVPGRQDPVPMREVMGEDAPVYAWLAANLYQSDPDMLTALIDRFDQTAAGYEPGAGLPQIQCPVLLLQADPAAGGLMTNAEVEQALLLLARPSHVRLEGVSHALHHIHPAPVAAALKAFLQSC
ncbi:MAG: alpha/beta hydrolase [Caldilineaceae bacterium]